MTNKAEDKLAALTDRELDTLIAEKVMEWQRQDGYNYWMTFPAGGTFELHGLIATWSPSTNISDAMEVEDRIAELGLGNEYIGALRDVTGADAMSFTWQQDWLIAHATPRQRCEAALAAIKE